MALDVKIPAPQIPSLPPGPGPPVLLWSPAPSDPILVLALASSSRGVVQRTPPPLLCSPNSLNTELPRTERPTGQLGSCGVSGRLRSLSPGLPGSSSVTLWAQLHGLIGWPPPAPGRGGATGLWPLRAMGQPSPRLHSWASPARPPGGRGHSCLSLLPRAQHGDWGTRGACWPRTQGR